MTDIAADRAFLGRSDVNSVESILADDDLDFGDAAHATASRGDAIFTWDYERTRQSLGKLYEKAKSSQWNGATDLDWSTEVDPQKVAIEMAPAAAMFQQRMAEIPGSPVARWSAKEWSAFQVEALNWRMSQFLHGEQGALLCTAKIVETTPWIDAKYYAASQVVDEARHVEVFSRYLDTKLDGHYSVNPALQLLIDDILGDPRWDMTYMGMQIMVEGLALAAFGFMHSVTEEPLLKKLLRYVMADEARHVEVFSRYLDTKLDGHYSVNPALQLLIDDILGDPRWDMTYMGMQIMVEGLALAAFGFMHSVTEEPLLKKLLRYVMADEARHVAFGVLSLQEYYEGLDAKELRERQEFAFEAAVRMRDRLMMHAVWEKMGVDAKTVTEFLLGLRQMGTNPFQAALFSKIVPNCKKLGLLDAGDGWLRDRFTEIGVIQFEDATDTGEEYVMLDEVAKDRAAAAS